MMESKKILQSEDLKIGYFHKKMPSIVARDINIQLSAGKLVALIGENGVGKSTLLRTLAGIQKPISGKVTINEKALSAYKPLELAKNLSLVLTEKLPPGNLTVFELIALGRQPYTNWIGKLSSEDTEKINQAMALTQTEYLFSKKHFEISDGQLQKVMIARALAQDTPIIILDEPTTHLDLHHKMSLFRLLKKLAHETNKCILFSTHDIELAIEQSDEMMVMADQKVIHATPAEHIAAHAFDRIFKNDLISFDSEKVKFVFKD